jgi:signal transduction histidine kinase
MRRILTIIISLLAVCLPSVAQNNPYEIDDECFKLFSRAEKLVGQPAFTATNDSLLTQALLTGDTKAQTLYYVGKLKNLSRLGRTEGSGVTDDDVRKGFEELKTVADKFNYPQYYYYAYSLLMTYFYNKGQIATSTDLAKEMQEIALERGEDYGRWMSLRFMVSLYMEMYDYPAVRRYAWKVIEVYEKTDDPLIKRQSVCRSWFDLADSYPVGGDSMRLCIANGAKAAIVHMDTLRARYYLAVQAALDRDYRAYKKNRDYCLKDPQLSVIGASVPTTLEAMDAVIAGVSPDSLLRISARIETFRGMKFIANVTEAYGYEHTAFELEKRIVQRMETKLTDVNHMRLAELNASLGNARLSKDLEKSALHERQARHIVTYLSIAILIVVLGFVLFELHSLRKRRIKDEKMIEDLKEANRKVQLADAAKTRFVQNMSHEVRTPLNAIVGFSQLLSLPDGSFPPEEKDEFAGHIVNNTKMLTMLLDDILNASAMDSGKYRISLEDGEMHFMAQAAISSAEHRLQPGVTMTYESSREEPFTFCTDPRRVQQILINLLTNACKHTEKGSIVLSGEVMQEKGIVRYTVTDTGTGIPADKAEAIFDRFTKLNDYVQGTGLGLSICRDIAGRMGASVYLDTTYTGGARFMLDLPIVPPENIDK